MSSVPSRGDPGPPDLAAAVPSEDGLPGRDVGHVVEVRDDEVGGRGDDAAQPEGQVEQRRRGGLMEADLPAGPGVEEIRGEVADARVKGGGLGLSGDDGARHGIEPALGVAGGLGGRIDGQAPGARIEVDAGIAQGIAVDHREAGPDPADSGPREDGVEVRGSSSDLPFLGQNTLINDGGISIIPAGLPRGDTDKVPHSRLTDRR